MPQDEPDQFEHYKILRRDDGSRWELNRGSMWVTYKAVDSNLQLPVALTVIEAAYFPTGHASEHFVQKARALAGIVSPYVATVYTFGCNEQQFFYVAEFIDGETLEKFVFRRGRLRGRVALKIALQVTLALEAAARAGLVHGDLTPANILIEQAHQDDGDYSVSVIGFGLKRWAAGHEDFVSPSVVPTADEASVMSVVARDIESRDIRSDIYSLGATLGYMLTGRPPSMWPLANAHGHGTARRWKWVAIPSLSEEENQLVARLLHHDPDQRPQNPAELRREIEACLARGAHQVSAACATPSTSVVRAPRSAPPAPPILDDNVQFTAYRPKIVRPGKWEKLLVFAHLDERPTWMDADERTPVEEVEAQAAAILGPKFAGYRQTTDDSRLAIPCDGEITLVPELRGFEFNPPQRSFFWKSGIAVHGETFEMRAAAALEGQVARGRLTIFLGALILAEISLAVRVESLVGISPTKVGQERSTTRPFRHIFASYSHQDSVIVEAMERLVRAFGDVYLRDRISLRSGENWNEGLQQMIVKADVFQLFWSHNASQSEYVRREWSYALALGRQAFVRPTYWEDPMPVPPPELGAIHFHQLSTMSNDRERQTEAVPRAAEPALASAMPTAMVPSPPRAIANRAPGPSIILIFLILVGFIATLFICVHFLFK